MWGISNINWGLNGASTANVSDVTSDTVIQFTHSADFIKDNK